MHSTDENNLLNTLSSQLQLILKNNLVGIYLYGSMVWGDFDPDISDIDLMVATNTELSETEFSNLHQMHLDVMQQFKHWNDRIEVGYLSKNALKIFKIESSQIAIISPGEPFHIKTAGIDWLLDLYFIRGKNVVISGPDPKTIIREISKEEFLLAVKNQVREWGDWIIHANKSLGYQSYVVLTLCRAFYTMHHGEQVSKKHAAMWAKKQFPEWKTLIENSLRWRMGIEKVDPEKTYPEVEKFVHQLVSSIQ